MSSDVRKGIIILKSRTSQVAAGTFAWFSRVEAWMAHRWFVWMGENGQNEQEGFFFILHAVCIIVEPKSGQGYANQ